ncbi:PaaI family thioesterase [Sulfurimonas sp.]|uniref:PaaI family thioesterase n=1 Tax=Sulfurimonas sp. TaxID=2022749 RepID=UPI0025D03B3E|nr:PaaI family thioesterase [Sulfurimonas sp.]
MSQTLEIEELLREIHGDDLEDLLLPPPSYTAMQCELVEFDKENSTLTTKIPVLESWLNPYATMQGGMIVAAIDNTLGPLSILLAQKNMTINLESKFKKPVTMDLEYIYVTASLVESKKRALIFEVVVKDKEDNIYITAKVINLIV